MEDAGFFDFVHSDWTKDRHWEVGLEPCWDSGSDVAEFESESELLRKSSSTPTGEELLSFGPSISAVGLVIA